MATQLPILVADRVEAVRTRGDDLFGLVVVERLDVGRGEHLVDVVVAHAPRRVAGARLFLAQHRVLHSGGVQTGDDCACDPAIAIVEGRGAAHPVQALKVRDGIWPARFDHRRGGRYLERQALRPVQARRLWLAPDIRVALDSDLIDVFGV